MQDPTPEAYGELDRAFEHFNAALFAGTLPHCLLTLQRKRRTYGYLSPDRFARRSGERAHELALNPAYFAIRPIPEVLSTLVHEQVHLWQDLYAKPGRGRYHNQEWADRMEDLGLKPSHTGHPGGRRTGDRMSHYIIPGGPFDRACGQLLSHEFTLSWLDRFPPMPPPEGLEDLSALDLEPIVPGAADRSNRVKYVCPTCRIQAWGKPRLALRCGHCRHAPFLAPATV